MKNYMYVFEKRLNGILSLLALFLWIRSILHSLDLYNVFTEWLNGLLDEEWKLGTTTISFGGILGFITVVLITYLLTRFVKLVVEEELFMRIKMPRGIPQAISLVIRYIIVVFGIYLALAAAGVDLDRFGLIAGALGVGIGFGLQNIVNNFIAGLILVFERPIQVGDTVEVGTLLGRVKRIGVRSSNVRTYDGAEVIVPNGNLTSKEVINWTLSDQVRRIEVKVGVAYGSDPNTVLEILKKITNEHENVLDEPPPLPLFVEFGDSSLNFRVLFWVYYEQGLSTRSDITIRLYNELDKAGITIPFPQRDLNFKAMQPKDKKKLLDALKDEEEDL